MPAFQLDLTAIFKMCLRYDVVGTKPASVMHGATCTHMSQSNVYSAESRQHHT